MLRLDDLIRVVRMEQSLGSGRDGCYVHDRMSAKGQLQEATRDFSDDVRIFRDRRRRAPAHYHGCPECYEPEACTMDCTIEPDLGEHKGCAMGAYDLCSTCRKRGVVDAV